MAMAAFFWKKNEKIDQRRKHHETPPTAVPTFQSYAVTVLKCYALFLGRIQHHSTSFCHSEITVCPFVLLFAHSWHSFQTFHNLAILRTSADFWNGSGARGSLMWACTGPKGQKTQHTKITTTFNDFVKFRTYTNTIKNFLGFLGRSLSLAWISVRNDQTSFISMFQIFCWRLC